METVYIVVVVKDYDTTVLSAKTSVDKVPTSREKVVIDFDDPETEFIGGEWGREAAKGKFSFKIHEIVPADTTFRFPTIVCLLQEPDEDTS